MRFHDQFLQKRGGLLWWRRNDLIPYQGTVEIHRGQFKRAVTPDPDGWVDVVLEPGDLLVAPGIRIDPTAPIPTITDL